MEFKSGNPALKKAFGGYAGAIDRPNTMTIQGAVNKTALFLSIVFVAAAWSWNYLLAHPETMGPALIGCAIGGLIFALVTMFKQTWAPVTGSIYALLEGVVLGAISMAFEQVYHGIAIQAILLTFGVLGVMLVLYKARIIQATARFRTGVLAATGAIMLVYLVSLVMNMFGVTMPYLHEAGPLGIGISLVIIAIAALNLILDFDMIEQGAAQGAPKYLEWYAAFGLLLTLIWLYLEILRLLSKFRE